MAYHRVQLLLTHEQHRKLKQLARLRKTSVSALVREFVERGLQEETARGEADWIERTRRVTQALLEARGGKPIEVDPVQLLREIREERGHALAPWVEASDD